MSRAIGEILLNKTNIINCFGYLIHRLCIPISNGDMVTGKENLSSKRVQPIAILLHAEPKRKQNNPSTQVQSGPTNRIA